MAETFVVVNSVRMAGPRSARRTIVVRTVQIVFVTMTLCLLLG